MGGVVGEDHLVVVDVIVLHGLPREGDESEGEVEGVFRFQTAFGLQSLGCLGRLHVADAQYLGYGVADVVGRVVGSYGQLTCLEVGHVDGDDGVGGCQGLVNQRTPLALGDALMVVHRHGAHVVGLHRVLAEVDGGEDLLRGVVGIAAVYLYQRQPGRHGRPHVADGDGMDGRRLGQLAEGVVGYHAVLVGARLVDIIAVDAVGSRHDVHDDVGQLVQPLPLPGALHATLYLVAGVEAVGPAEVDAVRVGDGVGERHVEGLGLEALVLHGILHTGTDDDLACRVDHCRADEIGVAASALGGAVGEAHSHAGGQVLAPLTGQQTQAVAQLLALAAFIERPHAAGLVLRHLVLAHVLIVEGTHDQCCQRVALGIVAAELLQRGGFEACH